MKKYLMAGVLASLLLCCTGCGKKLTCTGKMMGMDAEVVTKFSGDKAKSASMKLTMDMKDLGLGDDISDDDMKKAADEMKKQFEDNDEYDDVKVTTEGTKIIIECDYEIQDDDERTSYDETKEDMEKSGLTCK